MLTMSKGRAGENIEMILSPSLKGILIHPCQNKINPHIFFFFFSFAFSPLFKVQLYKAKLSDYSTVYPSYGMLLFPWHASAVSYPTRHFPSHRVSCAALGLSIPERVFREVSFSGYRTQQRGSTGPWSRYWKRQSTNNIIRPYCAKLKIWRNVTSKIYWANKTGVKCASQFAVWLRQRPV